MGSEVLVSFEEITNIRYFTYIFIFDDIEDILCLNQHFIYQKKKIFIMCQLYFEKFNCKI